MRFCKHVCHLSLLILLLQSCSSSKQIESKRETSKNVLVRQKFRAGPSLVEDPVFVDKSQTYGLAGVEAVRFYAIDLNSDRWTDLVILPSEFSKPHFYLFNPKKRQFVRTRQNFFEEINLVSFLVFADLDADGVLDAITGAFGQKTSLRIPALRVYRGTKNGRNLFFKVSEIQPLTQAWPTAGLSLIDYDLDGDLDLFLPNWYRLEQGETALVPDRLFEFQNWQFKDVSQLLVGEQKYIESAKRFVNATPSMGSSTCDVDQNGYPDILTVSSHGHANRLWLNLAKSKISDRNFRDYGLESGYAGDLNGRLLPNGNGHSHFSSCADYNNDQLMDIFVGELFHSHDRESVDKSSILTGSQFKFPPKFLRTDYIHSSQESWNQADRRAIWADLNFDGYIDLLVDNAGFPPQSRLVYFEQAADHSFEDKSSQVGIDILNPSGTILLDVNQDGRPDILTGQTSTRAPSLSTRLYLFENQIPYAGRRSLRIRLQGKRANIQGIGASVILKTSKNIRKQWIEFSQGHQPSQNENGLFFGLERKEKLEFIEVRWPIRSKTKSQPLTRRYRLNALQFEKFLELTLCENGEFSVGRQNCR